MNERPRTARVVKDYEGFRDTDQIVSIDPMILIRGDELLVFELAPGEGKMILKELGYDDGQ